MERRKDIIKNIRTSCSIASCFFNISSASLPNILDKAAILSCSTGDSIKKETEKFKDMLLSSNIFFFNFLLTNVSVKTGSKRSTP